MGLFDWFFSLFGGGAASPPPPRSPREPSTSQPPSPPANAPRPTLAIPDRRIFPKLRRERPLRWSSRRWAAIPQSSTLPYQLARRGTKWRHYLDLSQDGDDGKLIAAGLPVFHTPEELADWLGLPLSDLAWLTHHFSGGRARNGKGAHYHFHWIAKRRGGWRLIEAPKALLKTIQTRILEQLLNQVPAHPAAHGAVKGRSIITNAEAHVGQAVVVKLDLKNFYPSIPLKRVIRLFRSLGYSREAALWLSRLVTSSLPTTESFPQGQQRASYTGLWPYYAIHVPQGAPTSPQLTNLMARRLDARLDGLAKSFGATYTRYADDLTFSGPQRFVASLRVFIPLVKQLIKREHLQLNGAKTQVLRASGRQAVTGVVVNEQINVKREEFDRLKAILTNCLRHGPSTQNRADHPNFELHLRGRIAHVAQLNPARGEKLWALCEQIDWSR